VEDRRCTSRAALPLVHPAARPPAAARYPDVMKADIRYCDL
jgi:hypothetical protein